MGTSITQSSGPKITHTQTRRGVARTSEPRAEPVSAWLLWDARKIDRHRHLGLGGTGTTGSLARASKSFSTGQTRWQSACMAWPRGPRVWCSSIC